MRDELVGASNPGRKIEHRTRSERTNYYHAGIKIKIILCTGYDSVPKTDESRGLIRTRGYETR